MRVAANRGNELVTSGGLGNWPSTLVQPFLQVGLTPVFVQPITRVGNGLTELLCNCLIVFTSSFDQNITGARLRRRDSMTIEKCFQMGL